MANVMAESHPGKYLNSINRWVHGEVTEPVEHFRVHRGDLGRLWLPTGARTGDHLMPDIDTKDLASSPLKIGGSGIWLRAIIKPRRCLMFALSVVLTILLLLEALPSAVVSVTRAKVGLTRLDQVTRLGVLEGRNMGVVSLLGVLHSLGCIGVIVGLAVPPVGVAGAAIEAGIFGWVLYRQLRAGDRGRALGAYTRFPSTALAAPIDDGLR